MKKQILMFWMLLPGFLYITYTQAEPVYYVQNANANVRSDPSFGAKVIAKVAQGQALSSISKQGSWIKVKVDGKEGYISALLVSTQPPLAKQTVVKKEEPEEAKPTARRRASSYTSAAAARGLTEEERKREGIEERSDFNAVKKMESIKVAPEEVTKFKETGK
jgi:uncharacterized protein YgiM (DUF1202 family)